jgi:N-acetylmuramoyl-L-alanine amidase
MDDNSVIIVDKLQPWYVNLPPRSLADITEVVLHATEIPRLDEAWDYAMRSVDDDGVGVCGHLYIDRDGACFRFIPIDRVANHARGHNTPSIGIELINTGRYPNHFDSRHQEPDEVFPEPQVHALTLVLTALKKQCQNLAGLVRHSDIDQALVPSSDDANRKVRRRIDPGPQFPWEEVSAIWNEQSTSS